jgi:hypothetical protein
MELTNSKRLLYTASYVTTHLTPDEQHRLEAQPGRGYQKANLLRGLGLRAQDLGAIRERITALPANAQQRQLRKLLTTAETLATNERGVSTMALAAAMAPIPEDTILHFAKFAPGYKDGTVVSVIVGLFERQRRILPIGRLHLERIEMYPAGVQKGELVFTVPMAPGETVTISHKEWSTSSREYEEIVQDFFESYSERGVAEKTDASMSTESESKHSSALNFGATLSGEYAGVTLTTTLGLSNTSEERESAKQSMQRSREVTEKASARTRKEHKVSVKLEAKKGSEDSAYRTISNPATNAIRVDYYRMMRKWRTDLFRYGLRLTYDLAFPTPGVRLWAQHERLAALDKRLRTPLTFGLLAANLNEANYEIEATKVLAVVDDTPPLVINTTVAAGTEFLDEGAAATTRYGRIDFDVPAGYKLLNAALVADMAVWAGHPVSFRILNAEVNPPSLPNSGLVQVTSALPEHLGRSGHLVVTYEYRFISQASIAIDLQFQRLTPTFEAWQRSVWRQIRAAAEARYQEETGRVQEERDRLWALLNSKDTLSLRRLEREELLRLVMQWLLGPDYPAVATAPVEQTLVTLLANEQQFQTATAPVTAPTFAAISEPAWHDAVLFGEFVKFMQQAIEWENLLYFLYPYFWGSEMVGRDKLLFEHSDPEHEKFLRAGYARVVITVRPGFEEDFTKLVESGSLGADATSPYLPMATEIANFAKPTTRASRPRIPRRRPAHCCTRNSAPRGTPCSR